MAFESFECAKHSLVGRSTIEPTMVGPGKRFQNKDSWKVGKHYFEIGFYKYSIS